MASLARGVVEELHQIDAMSGDTVTKRSWCDEHTPGREITIHRLPVGQIQFAESFEILLPFFHKVGRRHNNDRPTGTGDRHAVGDGQGHEGFTHADFIGEDHTRLLSEPAQNLGHLRPLAPLVHLRHLPTKPGAQHQIRRQPVYVAHAWHRLTTRFQKLMASAEILFPCGSTDCSSFTTNSWRKDWNTS